jgi:RNA polymerase sigma-70 factor, ECF subfamily
MQKHDLKSDVRLMKLSDKDAYRRIFNQYAKKVYYFAFSYVRSKEDAEEIVQEVFARLWEQRASLDEEKSLSGFLFTISYRLIMDEFRRKKSLVQHHEHLFHLLTDEAHSTEEQFFYEELESLYQDAIEKLPPRRREVFRLSRQEGLTYQQIASQLGISVKTVEHQLSHALHFLREYFKQHAHSIALWLLIWLEA